ncbi:MAG: hypothetical protein ACFFHV_21125 [Promethearchaeota archaeon]
MFLEKLLDFPKNKLVVLITILAFILGVFINQYIMAPIEAELKSSTGYGVIDFEFAWTSDQISRIFKAWGSEGKKKEALVTYIDFLFIPCYSLFMAGCILLVTRNLEGKLQEVGLFMTIVPFIAGIFDVIENINLLLMLIDDSFIWSLSPFIASLCATIKFSLIFIAIIFFIVGLVIVIMKKFK